MDLATLAKAVSQGDLGDRHDWEQAERRWKNDGVSAEDLAYEAAAGLPFDSAIGAVGFPTDVAGWAFHQVDLAGDVESVVAIWRQSALRHRRIISDAALFAVGSLGYQYRVVETLTPEDLRCILQESSSDWVPTTIINALPEQFWRTEEGINVLDLIGECNLADIFPIRKPAHLGDRLSKQVIRDPDREGILRLLATMCRWGYRPDGNTVEIEAGAHRTPRHQESVQLIQLAAGRWREDQADALANEFARHQERTGETVQHVLSILTRHPPQESLHERLLTKLYAALALDDRAPKQAVMDAMLAQQRHRLSAILALESATKGKAKSR
jgi:hypothetical protein